MTKLVSTASRHLGLKEARPGSVRLSLRSFVSPSALAAVPAVFGHESLVAANAWGMLGNDVAGDCVWAGAAHETMLFAKEGGSSAAFTAANALADYAAVTGYDPKDPASDRGTDMDAAAKYRRKTGVIDSKGRRHKIAAYLDLTPGDLQELLYASYWFGAVGIGIRFPAFAMDQFDAGHAWDVQRANAKIEGGHYVPGVARRAYGSGDAIEVVTWGRVQTATDAFIGKYCDQGIAYLSTEILSGKGVTPEGLNLAALQDAFANVTRQ